MMGYAECREDLAKGDELCGLLRTRDLGFLDEAGRLTLTGRASRSGKVYGLRVNLDEVEKLATSACACAVIKSATVVKRERSRNACAASSTTADMTTNPATARPRIPS